jgi:DNA modification methylase
MPLIKNKINDLKDLISPRRDIDTPLYNWHAFKHSYSKDLVDYLIKDFKLTPGTWVLDNFCGGGTTLLACKEKRINTYGIDILPFSVFLSKVKTRNYNIASLEKDFFTLKIYKKARINQLLPQIEIVPKAFTGPVQKEIIYLLKRIKQLKNYKNRDFFKLAVFSILESISRTSKSGGFLRLVKRNTRPEQVHKKFVQQCAKMIEDLRQNKNKESNSQTIIELQDSRKYKTERKFDAVITSPPYPNRHDYTRIYSLELITGFISSNRKLKQLRYKTLRSHVEAKETYLTKSYSPPLRLCNNIKKIKKNGTNNPLIVKMIEGYFKDMYLVLEQIKRSLKKGGRVAVVVSNVRFSGENILVDEILGEIGKQVGLIPEKILVARYRGNSAQQMGEFSRNPSRESIVIWKN